MTMKSNRTIATIFALVFLMTSIEMHAQFLKPKFGLRAGMNISTMLGPQETGTTEGNRTTVLIGVAGGVKLPLNERIGLIAEVSFVQKGSFYFKEAENSFLKLPEFNSQQPITYVYTNTGGTFTKRTDKNYKKRVGMNVINGYIEVPVLFYAEAIDDKLEFEFGPSIGFLISSQALGTLKFGPEDVLNAEEPDAASFMEMDLDYKFIQDNLGDAYNPTVRTAKIDGSTQSYPTGPSAYYFTDETERGTQNRFSTVDFGLQFGASYYFSKGLKLGFRLNYSLLDITVDKYDHSFTELNEDGTYKALNHRDANFGCQIFVGLQF